MPTVSVIMAVYNCEKYLAETIRSILAQSLRDFEFIILEDGSKDGSRAICERFAADDSRIRLIIRPNKGLTRSLNEGIGLAQGEFLARMDGDDVALPDRFQKQVDYLREHPDCVLVGSRVLLIDSDGSPIEAQKDMPLDHETIDRHLLEEKWPLVHPAVMMRASAVRQVGGYNEQFKTNQDHDIFLRLAEIGRLANHPDILLKYRKHFEQVCVARNEQQGKFMLEILRQAHERRGITGEAAQLKPRGTPLTPQQLHRAWAWAALKSGHVGTARKHAYAALKGKPFSGDSWKLMLCALRGH